MSSYLTERERERTSAHLSLVSALSTPIFTALSPFCNLRSASNTMARMEYSISFAGINCNCGSWWADEGEAGR
jgi:hypothetical protein